MAARYAATAGRPRRRCRRRSTHRRLVPVESAMEGLVIAGGQVSAHVPEAAPGRSRSLAHDGSVPATIGGGYTSQIVISSKDSNATAIIRAYQSDNGNQIDVLDSADNAITGSVSLAPAYSSKRFKLEGIRGWHTVIVEHPSERAMNRATVVMRLREPNGGVLIVPMEGVSDCVTAGTNTE